jgi:hypothetical protein
MDNDDDDTFPWPELLPELQNLIRGRLGPLSTRMLQLTCRREHEVRRDGGSNCELAIHFRWAALAGHLAICKWIYTVTKEWATAPTLLYGSALRGGHLHVADWADDLDLPLETDSVWWYLAKGPLESLQWLCQRGHSIPSSFPLKRTTHLPIIKWLTHDLGHIPRDEVIFAAFEQLPASAERLLFFLDLPDVKKRFEISVYGLRHACWSGAWNEVDFVREHFPEVLHEALKEDPNLAALLALRTPVAQGDGPNINVVVSEDFVEPFDRMQPGPIARHTGYRRSIFPYMRWKKFD